MRVLSVHSDVIIVQSAVWQTTATIVRHGDEAFVIDSPVLPDELEMLPGLLEQAGFPFSGLLATHGDWDHLLGRLAFPGASLGVAETTAERLQARPGQAQRELRDFDERFYVEREAPLALGSIDALPVPGYCGLGDSKLELHPADGHTVDGMAVWIPWAKVLVCGDYLSPVEIPVVEGSVEAYLATLDRLEGLVAAADWVVAGHGGAFDSETALRILDEDRGYLIGLQGGVNGLADVSPARCSPSQLRLHRENVARFASNA